MQNQILDIVIKLAEMVHKDSEILKSEGVKRGLMDQNYSIEDIENAMGWVNEKLVTDPDRPFRILSDYERSLFTNRGHGFLIKLRNLGLLTDDHLELIIARSALMGDGPLDIDSIRAIAVLLLFDLNGHNEDFSIYLDLDDKQDFAN